WVYYKDITERYTYENDKLIKRDETQVNEYNEIPWNVGRNNICYEPDFQQVVTYINIIDAIQTNTLNALDKNGRAVILTSLPKTPEISKDLQNLNTVFDMERGDGEEGKDFFDYASMELNTDLREHMLDHFINELHKISGIFDFTKLDLGQDPSGTALQYRIYPMELKASEKVAYRLEFLRHRYELINQIINKYTISGSTRISNADVDELEITMKRNIPENVKAILEENMLMSGYVDKTTLIERIQGLDAQKIQDRKEKEVKDEGEDFITSSDSTTEV
ncbi:MAG: phage portal protein, partial [Alphaproteobacteria bacterium]|nr:phage portal protein [Alphaproteobacteria bacterium]